MIELKKSYCTKFFINVVHNIGYGRETSEANQNLLS